MIYKHDAKNTAIDLKYLLIDFNRRKNEILDNNRKDYIYNMPSGSVIPETINLNDVHKEEATKLLKDLTEAIRANMRPHIEKLLNDITEAPTEEAVRMLSVVQNRSSITAEEIDYLMNKYGKNVQVYNALRDIAVAHDFYDFKINPTMRQLEDIQRVETRMDRYNYIDIENGQLTDTDAMLTLTAFEDATGLEQSNWDE